MIHTQHDERRKRNLLTQREVCEIAGCSPGRLQYHTRHGQIDPPERRLHSRFFYTEEQARKIAAYFKGRAKWLRDSG